MTVSGVLLRLCTLQLLHLCMLPNQRSLSGCEGGLCISRLCLVSRQCCSDVLEHRGLSIRENAASRRCGEAVRTSMELLEREKMGVSSSGVVEMWRPSWLQKEPESGTEQQTE